MNGHLLDTNVVSELTNEVPHAGVVTFLVEHDDLWLSSVTVHELEYGLRLLPQGRRRDQLYAAHSGIIAIYNDRILPLDRAAAEFAADVRSQVRRVGRTLDLGDALIAGIARANDLAVVTRNVRDFDGLGVELVNPWQ